MKKVVVALLMLVGLAGFAQGTAGDKQAVAKPQKEKREHKQKVTPEEQAKQLAKELALDDAQQAKVKALYTEQEKKRAKLNPEAAKMEKGEKHDHAAMEKQIKEENTAFDTKMKGILSKEQYTKWKASLKTAHAKPEGKKLTEKKG